MKLVVEKQKVFALITAVCALLAFFLLSHGRALAVVEYCPATVSITKTADPSIFAMRLEAQGPRTVTGVVAMRIEDDWFSAPVSQIAFHSVKQSWRDATAEFTRVAYESDPIFIKSPTGTRPLYGFLVRAQATGDAIFGWDKRGDVECDPPPTVDNRGGAPVLQNGLELLKPQYYGEEVPRDAVLVIPAPLHLTPPDCPNPSSPAKATLIMRPEYPDMLRDSGDYGQTYVAVAVSATGKVDDAWVFAPSGHDQIDRAAVRAARDSSYEPARAFCHTIPGIFLYRADFRP